MMTLTFSMSLRSVRCRGALVLQNRVQSFARQQERAVAKQIPNIELRDRRQRGAVNVARRLLNGFIAAVDREEAASVDAELLVHLGDRLGLGGVELDFAEHLDVAALELAEQR